MKAEVKVLGPGCAKCKTLDKLTREVVEEHGFDVTVTKVEDIVEIMQYSVLAPPALVINNKVVFKGGVPSREKLAELIRSSING
jgi:small redox-active disulfide protein 2